MTASPRSTAPMPAILLALAIPSTLWGGALVSQYGFGLSPCEMCYWQRWPHEAAIIFALFALPFRKAPVGRLLVVLAALAIFVSGAIGVFHAGVEYHWWKGLTACTSTGPVDVFADIGKSIVRCDVAQWTLGGISLAGFNAIFSIGGAALILALLNRREPV